MKGGRMRFGIATTLGPFASVAAGQGPQSALGTLAREPTARVISSKEAGRLESRDSYAVFRVLILEDSTRQSKQVRGVRIDLPAGNRSCSLG
jgi:hypothetical protein